MKQKKPGDMFNKFQAKKKKAIAKSGSFGGKSNKLGQGGRAAQLVAKGVPGGVIGNLARAAQAAPGMKNFHKKGKKGKKKMKGGKKKKTLRSADEVVKSEQNASHKYNKGKKKKAMKKSDSKTSTATKTATSTKADTKHNVTVTGGAGDGDTTVKIGGKKKSSKKHKFTKKMKMRCKQHSKMACKMCEK